MDVGVEYRLPRRFAAVHTNIESMRLEFFLQNILDLSDEIKGIRVLLFRHLPERYGVSLWNNQGMPFRNREAVKESERQLSLGQQRTIYLAEDAIHCVTRQSLHWPDEIVNKVTI
jgi:hypothetical protein